MGEKLVAGGDGSGRGIIVQVIPNILQGARAVYTACQGGQVLHTNGFFPGVSEDLSMRKPHPH